MSEQLTPIYKLSDVPANMSEEEARKFWDSHNVTPEYLAESATLTEDFGLPPVDMNRYEAAGIPISSDLEKRLRHLAKVKHTSYRTLLEEFVLERTYEEEKRHGII